MLASPDGDDETDRQTRHIFLTIIIVAILSILVVVFTYIYSFNGGFSHKSDVWGQFGDYLGGTLNPLLSFLALIAVLLTFRLQAKELKNSTIELSKSSEALQQQVISIQQQNFENTFFNLLKLHHEIVAAISLTKFRGSTNVSGRETFHDIYARFFNTYSPKIPKDDSPLSEQIIEDSWNEILRYHQHHIGHYFRNLYTIIRFIDESNVRGKGTYIRIVRAQLSSHELALLFFNCLHTVGKRHFKEYVEKYGLLENMDESLITRCLDHKAMYREGAFHLAQS